MPCSLAFTSLEPLWRTNFAASILLATMAALVFLINCSYQDGTPEHIASLEHSYTGRFLAPLLESAAKASASTAASKPKAKRPAARKATNKKSAA